MSKILNHPDSEEIIRRLKEGGSIRKTAEWLKQKYPKNRYYKCKSTREF